MYILADENIPYVREVFTTLGEVRTINGRNIHPTDLIEIDLLLVRSITPVNADLLQNTSVKFVGSATIGYDHIDLNFLENNNIGFSRAPGSNATSAAEYVLSSLIVTAEKQGFDLTKKIVGIIGCGNVGSRVRHKLQALGITCLCYDPPLQEQTSSSDFVDLATVLTADIITLHVPLEKSGRHPTYLMVDQAFLARLHPDVILINTSRGKVIDESALLEKLKQHTEMTVILDVWANEPHINLTLLQQASLATPHIAGYSFDGKVAATTLLYEAVCQFFNKIPTWQARDYLPNPPLTALHFSQTVTDFAAIQTAILATYDVRRDDAMLRLSCGFSNSAILFDQLRKNYPMRREFHCVTVILPPEKSLLADKLRELGFKCEIQS